MNQVQKKYVILGSLCALLLTLAVGYAAFSSVLNISGTSSVNSEWNVQITNISQMQKYGNVTDVEGSPSYDNTNGLSATFNVNLEKPGDYVTYRIEITNKGSIDAILKKITVPENTNDDIVFYVNKMIDIVSTENIVTRDPADALTENNKIYNKSKLGNKRYVYVSVVYRDYWGQKTATSKTASMTINFDFEQATGEGIHGFTGENSFTTYYVYDKDGENWVAEGSSLTDIPESVYKTDYTELDSYKSGKTNFGKIDVKTDGKILRTYACQKFSFITEPVCLMDYYDEYNVYGPRDDVNKAILEGLQTKFIENGGSCAFDVINCNGTGTTCSYCTVGSLGILESYSVISFTDGSPERFDFSNYCESDLFGTACYES